VTLAALWTTLTAPAARRRRTAAVLLGLGVALPILAYGLHSWIASGIPFYAIGSENLTEPKGDVARSLLRARDGLVQAFGLPLLAASLAAFVQVTRRLHRDVVAALGVAALAPLAVTLTAYLAGHPSKARYPLLVAPALALALAAATRGRRLAQGAALLAAALQLVAVPRPLPVLRESTRDRRDVAERLPVLDEWMRAYDGRRILASMGSLAPVLYELGQRGVPLRDIVHEGNGGWWECAVVDPGREVGWVIVARGDVLDEVHRIRSRFPEGFTPFLRFGGVTIYRNDVPGHEPAHSPPAGAIN
jgi:hypothetical protein